LGARDDTTKSKGKTKAKPDSNAATAWQARNGTLTEKEGILTLTLEKNTKAKSGVFLTRNGLDLTAPVTAKLAFQSITNGQAATDTVIQLRLHLPSGIAKIRSIEFNSKAK
jgi:hypothetical protein